MKSCTQQLFFQSKKRKRGGLCSPSPFLCLHTCGGSALVHDRCGTRVLIQQCLLLELLERSQDSLRLSSHARAPLPRIGIGNALVCLSCATACFTGVKPDFQDVTPRVRPAPVQEPVFACPRFQVPPLAGSPFPRCSVCLACRKAVFLKEPLPLPLI